MENNVSRVQIIRESVTFNVDARSVAVVVVVVVDKMQELNHNCNTQTVLVSQKVSNMLKQKAVDCLSDKPSKIIRQALVEMRNIV